MEYLNKVKENRVKKGLTQKELAEKIGTSQQQIQRIESGAIKVRIETATKIADILGMKAEKLFPGLAEIFRQMKRKKWNNPLEMIEDEKVASKAEHWGIELDPKMWTLVVRLKGHTKELSFPMSSSDEKRLWYRVQKKDDEIIQFFVFDSEATCVSINMRQIAFCQTVFDYSPTEEERKEPKEVVVYLAGNKKPVLFEVDEDPPYEPGEDEGQMRSIFFDMDGGIIERNDYVKFIDQDGERVYINAEELALLEVPLWVVKPEILDAIEGEEGTPWTE